MPIYAKGAATVPAVNAPLFHRIKFIDGDHDIPARCQPSTPKSSIPLCLVLCLACAKRRCSLLLPVRQLNGNAVARVPICRVCWRRLTGQSPKEGGRNRV